MGTVTVHIIILDSIPKGAGPILWWSGYRVLFLGLAGFVYSPR